jgi:hypothetical protein
MKYLFLLGLELLFFLCYVLLKIRININIFLFLGIYTKIRDRRNVFLKTFFFLVNYEQHLNLFAIEIC